ncbi:putative glycosyl transferase, family 2 [Aliivibrio wodanis]|uniref:Putative glycosyl transferase, family 2 n=1 Tax=Aliivibrio wodanis TaxID=80852 RepID=A0A090KFB1_9GAMM|nr:putative glycosyl transferase, family 2 [Aliivibrio wodanis]
MTKLNNETIDLIIQSGLFDPNFYALSCSDLWDSGNQPTSSYYATHFFEHGFFEYRRPNPYFDPYFYENEYEDVKASGMHPLLHYIHHGAAEYRRPCREFDPQFYMHQAGEELKKLGVDPLYHYLHSGYARGLSVNGELHTNKFLAGQEPKNDYDSWLEANKWRDSQAFLLREKLITLTNSALLSVVMPVYNPPIQFLKVAIQSVINQVYSKWELCIADDASTDPEVKKVLDQFALMDSRIKVTYREKNGHISAATNSAAELASGDFLIFMDQDDEITPDALGEIALYMDKHPQAEVIYSDDDKIDTNGQRFAPQFKPDWSPELLLSYMYLGHIFSVQRDLYWQVGGTREGFEGSQDYDLALRTTEAASHIGHIPKVLYHWRVLPGSTAASGDEKHYSFNNGVKAVQEALDRRSITAKAYHPEWAEQAGAGIYSHAFGDTGPSVAIIIPTKNQAEILQRLLVSLEKTTYQHYSVYIINNESDEQDALDLLANTHHKVIDVPNPNGSFNYAYINNKAVEGLHEDYLLFLNNDTEVINAQWLSQMVGYAQIEGVKVVGARLLYPEDCTTQHAGVMHNLNHGLPSHCLKALPQWNGGYLSRAKVLGNFSAVTAACMLFKHDLFIALGGFDDTNFAVAYNDADLCYRVINEGHRIAYAPTAELFHHESKSRGNRDNPQEELNFLAKYSDFDEKYYNCNLKNTMPSHQASGRYMGELVKQKSRVAFLTHNLNLEGAPLQLLDIAAGFSEHAELSPIFISEKEGVLEQHIIDLGFEVLIIPDGLVGNLVGDYTNAIHEIKAWLQKQNIDLLVANTVLNFWGVDAAERAGIPSLWIIHESEPPFSHISFWCESAKLAAFKALDKAYQVIFVSEATKGLYQSIAPKQNLSVVYNGLDQSILKSRFVLSKEDARKELDVKVDETYTVLIGTVCERKGQLDFVKALHHLYQFSENMDIGRFAIVGDRASPYSDKLHQLYDSLPIGLQERIDIIEETRDVGLYFSAADIFVCTSYLESFPRVIQEAMYCELAIVTTPVFGIKEQVKDGVSAYFYKPKDHLELSHRLSTLIADPSERQRLGKNAKLHLQRLPDYQDMVNEYEALIFEALQ